MMKKKVLISGSYGTGNGGDEVILEQILDLLEDEYDIILVSHNISYSKQKFPNLFAYIEFSPVWEIKRLLGDLVKFRWGDILRRLRFIWWLGKSDIFWLGGGGLLSETVVSVLKGYLQQVKFATWLKKNVIIFDIGIGPLYTTEGRKNLFKTLFPWKAHLSVRDNFSFKYLQELDLAQNALLLPDPAFSYPAPVQSRVNNNVVIVNVYRVFTNKRLWPMGDALRVSFENELLKFLKELLQQNMEILLLPFGTSSDYEYALELQQRVAHPACSIIAEHMDFREIVAQFKNAIFSITMRFHAGLLSFCAGVPSLCIDAQFKSERLLCDMQLDDRLLLKLSSENGENTFTHAMLQKRWMILQRDYFIIQKQIFNYTKQQKQEYLEKSKIIKSWLSVEDDKK